MSRKRTFLELETVCKWCKRASRKPVGCPLGYTADCVWVMEFCTWECADAYSQMGGGTYYAHRHALLEAAAGRRVHPAPWWELLLTMTHDSFIAQVRTTLSAKELELACQQDQQSFGYQSGEEISVKRAHVTLAFIASTPGQTLAHHDPGSAHT